MDKIWSLLEIKLSSRKYTWANNQVDLIMSTIDRVFCSTELDSMFPLASISARPRCGSDHTPSLWDSGLQKTPKSSSYKMEKWWLLREDFKGLISRIWNENTKANSPLDKWQEKIRKIRKVTRGWSSNEEASIKRYKKILVEEFNSLDVKAETSALSTDELSRAKFINSELQKIWLQEEVKAKQRSRDRDIKEGDRNTSYFHAVANQRNRKVTIHSLDGPEGPVTDTREMLKVACDFYKDFLRKNLEMAAS